MKRQLISKRMQPNAGIAEWYSKELKKLTKAMTKECLEVLTDIYKTGEYQISLDESISSQARIALNKLNKKYSEKFDIKTKILVNTLLNKINKFATWQFNRLLKGMIGEKADGFILKGSAISQEKSEVIKALMFDNASLIKSIPSEYFTKITGSVARSIEQGTGIKQLKEDLMSYGAKSERRAELIALDQTRKAYTSINIRNFQEAGIKKFQWMHSGGSRDPRPYHKDVLNGNIYSLDDPPIIDPRTKVKGFPGDLPYCRCTMGAVLDFDD